MQTLKTLLALALFLGAGASAPAAGPAARDVVLIVADDLGLDLGCYGSRWIRTPALDALARRGVRFTDAFATVASCSASRAVIYSGLYTHTNGQFGHAHPPAELHTHEWVWSVPRVLRRAGYRTGVIGKLHVLPPEVYPFDVVPARDDPGGGQGRDVEAFGRGARRFFDESRGRPFFLLVGFHDPHRSAHGFGNERSHGDPEGPGYAPEAAVVPPFLPDRPEVRRELAEYARAVSRMDRGVALVLEALEQAGRSGNTLVVFLSDNGVPFPGAKTTLYEPGIHLPLIVASPAQGRRGLANRALVSWIDIAPTLLDWAGARAPYRLPGRSLLPILEVEDPEGWDAVFGSFVFHEITNYYPMRMLRTRRHKYILNLAHPLDFPFASDLYESATWQGVLRRGDKTLGKRTVDAYLHRPREELYDLDQDPDETRDLARDPANAALLAGLRDRLGRWRKETADPWIVKDRYE